ncbi:MAG: pectinesterase family protein, partial [Prevotella sp.]|nr:pectinesterase family protein [Prevotella sp.]
GGTRGIKVSVKGDGDTDWEVIHDKEIGTKSGEDLELEVNRTNCQIKFENYSGGLDNNAYVTDLAIYGSYTFTGPLLETVTVNGVDYDADDIFEEDNDGNMAGTVNISKTIENEDITVSATALNGTITNANNITVDVSDEGVRTATIEVTLDEETRKYILTIGDKPDYTLTYLDQNGDTLTETQLVEEDATIGEFKYSGDELTVADGYKFRGWFVSAIGGRKYTTDEVITEDITLYAIVTEIETESTTARYAYDLTDEYFYAEDHEAFNPSDDENVKWHDASHGWAISNGKSIDLLVGGNAYILLGLCNQTNSGTTITLTDTSNQTVYSGTAVGSSDGQILKIDYEGKADTLTLTASGGTVYLHSLVIGNIATASIETNDAGWYVVNVVEDEAQNGDELLKTLDIANLNASSESRTYIFLPNGTYDLGNTTLTKIYGENISLIGQSMDSTIIVNAAQKESIDQSATLLVTGDNCYIQDLTLENDYPYYTYDNGRAVCLWDQANHTICKNVRMLSYQDTYYSYNSTAEKYFETSDIHGTVDFICGNGVVFFKNCTITVEKRKADGTGECTITAPNTAANQDYGYVFYGCTIENKAAKYNLGRAWDKEPRSVFLYTTLKDTENLNSNRWNATGISTVPKLFAEYNSYNSEGTIINATTGSATNNVTFTGGGTTTTLNTILPESDAESYELNKVIDSSKWAPDKCATQLVMSTVSSNTSTETLADSGDEEEAQTTTLSWNAVDDALAYAIFKDGEFVEIINKSDNPSYEAPNDGKTYTVRVANQYGGFGDSSEGVTTLISNITDNGSIVKTVYYNLSGARVSSATKGVVIKVDTMENGKQVATKIVK